MAYLSYFKLWGSETDNIVSKRDKLWEKLSHRNDVINQLRVKVYDIVKKDEKPTTNFEPVSRDDVINKTYLDDRVK